jgi:hypothetical protein
MKMFCDHEWAYRNMRTLVPVRDCVKCQRGEALQLQPGHPEGVWVLRNPDLAHAFDYQGIYDRLKAKFGGRAK